MSRELPKPIEEIRRLYPTVWKAFNDLGNRCHEAGPLDEKSRRLVKLALSIGAGLEGATHSAVRSARKAGIKQEEIDQCGGAGCQDFWPAIPPTCPPMGSRQGQITSQTAFVICLRRPYHPPG